MAARADSVDPFPFPELAAYLTRPDPPPIASGAAAVRRGLAGRGAAGHGATAGEVAEFAGRVFERESARFAAASPARLEERTRLRDTVEKSDSCTSPWTHRNALRLALRQITGLRGHRVTECLTHVGRGTKTVQVFARSDGRGGKLVGLVPCGSAWACPVCAPRITERRRHELRAAVQRHRGAGGVAALATFTFSHGPGEPLAGQWALLGKALERWARDGAVKRFRARYGWRGRIRAREITWGVNGWHSHAHALELFDRPPEPDPDSIAGERVDFPTAEVAELAAAWQRACRAVGLDCSLTHGFTLAMTDVDDYVAKWGTDAELTKWHVKRGDLAEGPDERGLWGYSPFDLLRIFAGELRADPRVKLRPERAAALFTEYVGATRGTAQLHWTRGLKAALQGKPGAAADAEPAYELIGEVSVGRWRVVQAMQAEITFLGVAVVLGWPVAERLLDDWWARFDRWERARTQAAVRNRGVAYAFQGGGA